MIAYLHFGEDASWAVRLVMLSMCGIFFWMEMVTDGVLVHVLDEYMTVPMLSAVPRQPLFSKENLGLATITGLTVTALSSCIGMAAVVNV